MRLGGKVAIVTGAASGIGLASAFTFAREGARVVIVDVNRDRGEQAVQKIIAEGGEAVFECADISREAVVSQIVADTVARCGKESIFSSTTPESCW